MFTKLTSYIQKRIKISQEELEEVFKQCSYKEYKKREYLLRIGEQCRFIGFLNTGLIMITLIDNDGKELACNFVYEGCFFTYVEGLAENRSSHKNFIALENCEAIILDKEHLSTLFKANQKFETLFNKILTEDLGYMLMAEQRNKTQSLDERYLNFENQCPQAFQRIPLKYIATYLGVEPPSLSRLRKRLATK